MESREEVKTRKDGCIPPIVVDRCGVRGNPIKERGVDSLGLQDLLLNSQARLRREGSLKGSVESEGKPST